MRFFSYKSFKLFNLTKSMFYVNLVIGVYMKALIDLSNPKIKKIYEKFLKEVEKENLTDQSAVLTYNIFDHHEKEELKLALNAINMRIAIEEIKNDVFRPYRKHGYSSDIETLIKRCGEDEESMFAHDVIEKLEEKFYEILSDNEVIDV